MGNVGAEHMELNIFLSLSFQLKMCLVSLTTLLKCILFAGTPFYAFPLRCLIFFITKICITLVCCLFGLTLVKAPD